jgi:hypothetical protein
MGVMESILVSSTVFLVVFAGALAGMRLRGVVPQNQLGPEVNSGVMKISSLPLRDALIRMTP